MEIRGDEESQCRERVHVVTMKEFTELHESLSRKWQPEVSQYHLIQGVPRQLRARQPANDNSSVYDPKIVSLGPYHHGKPELREAEEWKNFSLDWFAEGDENKKLLLYNKLLEEIGDIRACYADITVVEKYDDRRLALMMLLDACFIINMMSNCSRFGLNTQMDWLDSRSTVASLQNMIRDVFVLENQIPFRVIQSLMSLQSNVRTVALVNEFLRTALNINIQLWNTDGIGIREGEDPPMHILEACRRVLTDTRKLKYTDYDDEMSGGTRTASVSHRSCQSVTDLKAKGIHFKTSSTRSFKDIAFNSYVLFGQLKLPVQFVSAQTQVMLSNLIAFEVSPDSGSGVTLLVLAYVTFMKSLIETPEDVKELQRKGILLHSFPNHEQAVQVFKDIDTFGYGDYDIFRGVKYRVEAHCRSRAKTWIANLIHTRFETPWSAIAFCAALLLLVLTFLQTYFTINPVQ